MFSTPSKKVSYICYTYIDLEENIKNFPLDQALAFFSLDKDTLKMYKDPKGGSHPFAMMPFQCVISDEHNFLEQNAERLERVKEHWQSNSGIPNEISRYVFKLDIAEQMAKVLYEEKKYAILGQHIIGKREDKLKKDHSVVLGNMQTVEKVNPQIVDEPRHSIR